MSDATLRIVRRLKRVPRQVPEVGTCRIDYEVRPICETDPHDPNVGLYRAQLRLSPEGLGVGFHGWTWAVFVPWGEIETVARARQRVETEWLREQFTRDHGFARYIRDATTLDPRAWIAEDMARAFYEADLNGSLWSDAPADERARLTRRMRAVLDLGIVGPLLPDDGDEGAAMDSAEAPGDAR